MKKLLTLTAILSAAALLNVTAFAVENGDGTVTTAGDNDEIMLLNENIADDDNDGDGTAETTAETTDGALNNPDTGRVGAGAAVAVAAALGAAALVVGKKK